MTTKDEVQRVAQVIYEELLRTIGTYSLPDAAEIIAWRLTRENVLA